MTLAKTNNKIVCLEGVVDLVNMSDDTGLMEEVEAGEKSAARSIASSGSDTSAYVSNFDSASVER